MANNTFLPVVPGPISAGAVESFANEDIGNVHYPAVKVYWGAAGVAGPASAANPLPVVQTGVQTVTANAGTGTFTVSGTVTATLGAALPAGTNNIGDVDIASIAAGTNTIGKIDQGLAHATSRWLVDTTGTVTLSANNNLVRLNDRDGSGLTSMARGGQQALSVQIVDAGGTQVTSFGGGITYVEDTLLPADPQSPVILARRRDTLTATEVSGDGDAIALNANSKGQLHTIAEIPASQLSPVGPLTKSASASVTMATDEQVAHDATDSGNPWKVGGQARTTNPTAVGDSDRVNFIADKMGKQIAISAIRERKGRQYTSGITGTSETSIIAAGGTGVFRDLYSLIVSNTSPNVVHVNIRDVLGGVDTVMVLVIPPSDTRGLTLDCGSAFPQSIANSQWSATLNAITGGSVHVTALYVENT